MDRTITANDKWAAEIDKLKGQKLPSWYGGVGGPFFVDHYADNKLWVANAAGETGPSSWFCVHAEEVAGDLGIPGASKLKLTAFGDSL